MREYMLYVIQKEIVRMWKTSLITPYVYEQFMASAVPTNSNLSKEFMKYLAQKKKQAKISDENYLRFDSLIESGNLDRVEAYPLPRNSEFRDYNKV